jgi:lysophospholipase L1-like esterase
VSNFGVSGKTMIRAVNDAYWTQPAFGNARASLPNVVVIELGTNDSKDYIWPWYKQNFKADYAAMVDTFKVLSTKPQVWVTLQPPANNPDWNMYDTTIDRQVNPAILEVAKQKGLPVIDLHTAMKGHGEWMQSDSVHPNATGAKALAGIVAELLRMKVQFHNAVPLSATSGGKGAMYLYAGGIGRGGVTLSGDGRFQWYRNDSLLVGQTKVQHVDSVAGTYKVSFKVDSVGESRIVSAGQYIVPSVGIGVRNRNKTVRVSVSGPGEVHVDASMALGPVNLRLWNVRGESVANGTLKPGVYHFRVQGRDFQNVGSVVVPH